MRAYIGLFLLTAALGCDREPEVASLDHPMGLAAAALRDTLFTWQTRETNHFRIHYQAESYAADHIDQFVQDAEQARANGLQVLGIKNFEPRIDVFHLKSREQMKHITEYAVRGWTDPTAKTVLLVRSSASNQGERHEIAHVLSHTHWGHSHDWLTTGWMSEALATYAGGPCSGYPVDEIIAYLDRQGELIPLDSLAPKFRTYNDLVAYLQAGSFFGYVREKHGVPRVRALWEQGFDRLEAILNKTPADIDAEWRAHLRESYPDPNVNWAPIKKDGCQ